LVLALERPSPGLPMEQSIDGLLEVLADLLLEAAGTPRSIAKGGVDEQQDHA
jgi:hypothetical protein